MWQLCPRGSPAEVGPWQGEPWPQESDPRLSTCFFLVTCFFSQLWDYSGDAAAGAHTAEAQAATWPLLAFRFLTGTVQGTWL